MRMWSAAIGVFLAVIIGGLCNTRTAAQSDLRFQTVSVKRHGTARPNVGSTLPSLGPVHGRWVFLTFNATARDIVRVVYSLRDYQLDGDPDWMRTERFDIEASAPTANLTMDDAASMWKAMLATRFQLRAHVATQSLRTVALTLSNGPVALGPSMRRATEDCNPRPFCAFRNFYGNVYGRSIAIENLVTIVGVATRWASPVVDRTGLTGRFDVDLLYLPERDDPAYRDPRIRPPGGIAPPLPPPDSPRLDVALQRQLGVTLENTTSPVDVLVIDHVEQPTVD